MDSFSSATPPPSAPSGAGTSAPTAGAPGALGALGYTSTPAQGPATSLGAGPGSIVNSPTLQQMATSPIGAALLQQISGGGGGGGFSTSATGGQPLGAFTRQGPTAPALPQRGSLIGNIISGLTLGALLNDQRKPTV